MQEIDQKVSQNILVNQPLQILWFPSLVLLADALSGAPSQYHLPTDSPVRGKVPPWKMLDHFDCWKQGWKRSRANLLGYCSATVILREREIDVIPYSLFLYETKCGKAFVRIFWDIVAFEWRSPLETQSVPSIMKIIVIMTSSFISGIVRIIALERIGTWKHAPSRCADVVEPGSKASVANRSSMPPRVNVWCFCIIGALCGSGQKHSAIETPCHKVRADPQRTIITFYISLSRKLGAYQGSEARDFAAHLHIKYCICILA